jgi:endoglucanase
MRTSHSKYISASHYILLLLLFLLLNLQATSQTIHETNERLGRGINYGNMFEAPDEGAWGNPWKPEYPGIISSLGFGHVRMPINWTSSNRTSENAPYTIDPDFLNRIKEVVDATLNEKLYVVINMHHHEALFADPEGQKDRFLAQWRQIGEFFRDYPDSLVFEILNEPHNNLDADTWNVFVQDALNVIREDNPNRPVLIGTAQYNSVSTLSQLDVPEDENIILTIHYYNPFQFTHQGADWVGEGADAWLGTEWLDSDVERSVITSEFVPLVSWSQETNIPVHIGEFGAFSMADIESRERWTTFLARYFESQEWSWAYWEFSAGFGIYEPQTGVYENQLVDALLENELPEPLVYERTTSYESDFSTDFDGWFLNVFENEGAIASLSREDGNLKVSIDQLGNESWHIQLIRQGIALEENKKYAIQFTAKATETRPAWLSVGQNGGSYTSYGTAGATLNTEFLTFTASIDMRENDPQARMVIDLGASLADFTLSEVKLDQLNLPGTLPDEVTSILDIPEITFYPNPTKDLVRLFNPGKFIMGKIMTLQGQDLFQQELHSGWNEIDLRRLACGIYFLHLTAAEDSKVVRLIRN